MTQTVHHYKGLSDNEVLESRKLHGINVLTQPEKETFWQKLLETFKHPISIVMFCLFALSVLTPFLLPIERIWAMTAVVAVSAVLIIMTGFFESMPNELIECACIEGANLFDIFFRICLPLGRTGLFVTGLMTFVGNWNELLLAMVFISDDNKKTLPVSLSKFVGPYNTNYSQMFAAIIIAIIPTVIVYCMFSNQIVDGLTAGAVKG